MNYKTYKELEALLEEVKQIRGGMGYSDELGELAIIITNLIETLMKDD